MIPESNSIYSAIIFGAAKLGPSFGTVSRLHCVRGESEIGPPASINEPGEQKTKSWLHKIRCKLCQDAESFPLSDRQVVADSRPAAQI